MTNWYTTLKQLDKYPMHMREIITIIETAAMPRKPVVHLAYLGKEETTAKKVNGVWLVGGDVVQPGARVSIACKEFHSGRLAWHTLKGNRLIFDDYLTDAEIARYRGSNKIDEAETIMPVNPAMPDIKLIQVDKTMRLIVIDSQKAGSLHFGTHNVFAGFNKWRKQRHWSGEFEYDGTRISVGATEKVSDLLPKVTKLVRSYLIRKAIDNQSSDS